MIDERFIVSTKKLSFVLLFITLIISSALAST